MPSTTADTRSGMERNMRLLPWWWVVRWIWLGEAVWIIYLIRERGLTLGQVALFEAVFMAVVLAGEVPTGMIADRYGRRISLLLATTLTSAAFITFGLSTSASVLLVSYAMFGVADAFMSGADTALLFDTMRRVDRENEFAGFVGRLGGVQSAAIAVLTVIGAVLADAFSLATPIVLSGVLTIPAIGIAWFLVEPSHEGEQPSFIATGRLALRRVSASRAIWAAILIFGVVNVAIWAMAVTIQPVAAAYGLPLWTLGLFIGAQMLSGSAAAWFSGPAGRRLGLRRTLLTMPLLGAISLLGGAHGAIWLFPIFILPTVGWNVLQPHITDYLSRRSPDRERATVLSMMNFAASVGAIIASVIFGLVVDDAGIGATLTVIAGVLTVLGLLTYALWASSGDTAIEPREAVAAGAGEAAAAREATDR
jgi:MFS family permease